MDTNHSKLLYKNITFSPAKNEKQLIELLQLRYQIYTKSKLSSFIEENDFGIDLDEYDLYANHLGIFKIQNNRSKPIGYVRIIQKRKSKHALLIERIATNSDTSLLRKINSPRKSLLPTQKYFPKINCKNIPFLKGLNICEGSRLVIKNEYQNIRLAIFLVECMIAFAQSILNFDLAFLSCRIQHAAFYKKYGFQNAPYANGVEFIPTIGGNTPYAFLVLTKSDISKRHLKRILNYSKMLSSVGSITFQQL